MDLYRAEKHPLRYDYANIKYRPKTIWQIDFAVGYTAMKDRFGRFSRNIVELIGSPAGFALVLLFVLVWGMSELIFDISGFWSVVLNILKVLITFFMVFLIQNAENRHTKALHLKLDELIRSIESARKNLIKIEELSDEELEKLEKQFNQISEFAAQKSKRISKTMD